LIVQVAAAALPGGMAETRSPGIVNINLGYYADGSETLVTDWASADDIVTTAETNPDGKYFIRVENDAYNEQVDIETGGVHFGPYQNASGFVVETNVSAALARGSHDIWVNTTTDSQHWVISSENHPPNVELDLKPSDFTYAGLGDWLTEEFYAVVEDADGDNVSWEFWVNGQLHDSGYAEGIYNYAVTVVPMDTPGDYSVELRYDDGYGELVKSWPTMTALYPGTDRDWETWNEGNGMVSTPTSWWPGKASISQFDSVLKSSSGDLWVGGALTNTEGGFTWAVLRRDSGGTWHDYTFNNTAVNQASEYIVEDGLGRIWFAGSYQLVVYDSGTWTQVWDTTAHGMMEDLAVDGAGNVYVATAGDGLYRIASGSTTPIQFHLPGKRVMGVDAAPNGDIWIGTAGDGVQHYSGGSWTQYFTSADNYTLNYTIGFGFYSNGKVIAAGEFMLYEFAGGEFVPYTDPITGQFANFASIEDIFSIGDDIWVCTYDTGVWRIRSGEWLAHTAFNNENFGGWGTERTVHASGTEVWVTHRYNNNITYSAYETEPVPQGSVNNKFFNLQATDEENTGRVRLDWDRVYGFDAPQVQVYYSHRDFLYVSSANQIATLDNDTTTYTITGLQDFVTYYFAVVPDDDASRALRVYTAEAMPTPYDSIPPAPVRDTRITVDSDTSVTLTWTPNTDDAVGYNVYWHTNVFQTPAEATWSDNLPGRTASSYSISGLETYLPYYVSVVAYDANGNQLEKLRTKTFTCAYGTKAQWTVMVYMDGDNDLEFAALDDLNEMDAIGSTDDVNIIVLRDLWSYGDSEILRIDRDPSGYAYDDGRDSDQSAADAEILDDHGFVIGADQEVNMGDPQTLTNFVIWTMANYPSENYWLDVWDHGGGWSGACWDDTNNYDHLSATELDTALGIIETYRGSPLELLSFDCCLNGMVEMAYQLGDHVGVFVGSEDSIPGDGFFYNHIFQYMLGNPNVDPYQLGAFLVQDFVNSYASRDTGGGSAVTLAAVDTHAFFEAAAALDVAAGSLMANYPSVQASVRNAREGAQRVNYGEPGNTASHVDVIGFLNGITTGNATLNKQIADAADLLSQAVFAEGHGNIPPSWPSGDFHGLMIYFPQTAYAWDSSFLSMAFAQQTMWDEFLDAYAAGSGPATLQVNIDNPSLLDQWAYLFVNGETVWWGNVPAGTTLAVPSFTVAGGFQYQVEVMTEHTLRYRDSATVNVPGSGTGSTTLNLGDFGWIYLDLNNLVTYELEYCHLFVDGYYWDEVWVDSGVTPYGWLYLMEGPHTFEVAVWEGDWAWYTDTATATAGSDTFLTMDLGDAGYGWVLVCVYNDASFGYDAQLLIDGALYDEFYVADQGWNFYGFVYLSEGQHNFVVGAPSNGMSDEWTITVVGGVDTNVVDLYLYQPYGYLAVYIYNQGIDWQRVTIYIDGQEVQGVSAPSMNWYAWGWAALPSGSHWVELRAENGLSYGYQHIWVQPDQEYELTWTIGSPPTIRGLSIYVYSWDPWSTYVDIYVNGALFDWFVVDYGQNYYGMIGAYEGEYYRVSARSYDGTWGTQQVLIGSTDAEVRLSTGDGEPDYDLYEETKAGADALTASITSPADGTMAPDTLTVTGTASSTGGAVAAVWVKLDLGEWYAASGTASWSYALNTTSLANGDHMLYVKATDGEMFSAVQSLYFTVSNPGPSGMPAANLTSHAGNTTASGSITLSGTASTTEPGSQVLWVKLRVDDGPWELANGTTSWRYDLDTTQYSDGYHVVAVKSFDGYQESPMNHTLLAFSNVPAPSIPEASITSPSAGATVSGTITVSGSASPNGSDPLTDVYVKVDDGDWARASGTSSWSYSLDTTALLQGRHAMFVRSYNGLVYSPVAMVNFTVDNTLSIVRPFVQVNSPAANATLSGTVTISGNASGDLPDTEVFVRIDGGDWVEASLDASTGLWSAAIDTQYYEWGTRASTSTGGLANGVHTISAKAVTGNVASEITALPVSVNNTPLTIDPAQTTNPGAVSTPTFPLVVSVTPADAAADVAVDASIVVAFNVAMDTASAEAAFSLLGPSGAPVAGAFAWNAGSTELTFTPSANLSFGGNHTVVLQASAMSAVGLQIGFLTSTAFVTVAETPVVVSTAPSDGDTDVQLLPEIVVVFSIPMNQSKAEAAFALKDADGSVVAGAFKWSPDGKTMTFTPDAELAANTTYTATLAATDALNGVPLASATGWSFTTGAGTAAQPGGGQNGTGEDAGSNLLLGAAVAAAVMGVVLVLFLLQRRRLPAPQPGAEEAQATDDEPVSEQTEQPPEEAPQAPPPYE